MRQEDTNSTFSVGKRIRIIRKKKGMSQEDLAECIGAARETISRLENGKYQSPKYRLIYDIAVYFEKPIEEIFFYVEENSVRRGE